MIPASPLSQTQYRLARHYLNKLRSADAAVRRGQTGIAYGTALFDQEWEHIRHWQSWAASRWSSDEVSARLCKEFPLAGMEILASRNNAADQAAWFLSAFEAAQRLHDREAERTLCYKLLMISYRLGIPEKIEDYARQLLQLGEAAKDVLAVERALFGFGLVAEERGQYVEAESYYQRALQLAQELGDDDETGQALNGLGTISTYLGDYQKAYPYFSRQLELMEKAGTKSDMCHALLSMGGLLLWMKDYTRADEYLQRAVTLSRALGLRRLLGVSLIHLGASALEQNHLETAYRELTEGLETVRRVGIVRQIMTGLSLLGYTWLRMGDPQAALTHLHEGLALAREAKSPRNIFNLQYNLAKTYLVLYELDLVRSALLEALTHAQSMGGHPQKVEAVSIAVAYYQSLGLNEQAAVWAGTIQGDAELDLAFIMPIYAKLEAALGAERYQAALQIGKSRLPDDVVAEILSLPS